LECYGFAIFVWKDPGKKISEDIDLGSNSVYTYVMDHFNHWPSGQWTTTTVFRIIAYYKNIRNTSSPSVGKGQ